MRLLRPLEGLLGVLQRLLRKLVPGQVIFFPVVRGGSAVRVRGEFVEFGSSLVRVIWHDFLPLVSYHNIKEFNEGVSGSALLV